jgi:hypothetical protein
MSHSPTNQALNWAQLVLSYINAVAVGAVASCVYLLAWRKSL